MAGFVEIFCISNKYYHGICGEMFVTYPELIVNQKYLGRPSEKRPNTNRDKFYDIKGLGKLYRKEMFRTLKELRDEKLDELLCD